MSVVQINGQQIHFTDTGTRPETSNDRTAVVFSHGALLDSTIWQEQLEALAPTQTKDWLARCPCSPQQTIFRPDSQGSHLQRWWFTLSMTRSSQRTPDARSPDRWLNRPTSSFWPVLRTRLT
jgi:hypothetical protein